MQNPKLEIQCKVNRHFFFLVASVLVTLRDFTTALFLSTVHATTLMPLDMWLHHTASTHVP